MTKGRLALPEIALGPRRRRRGIAKKTHVVADPRVSCLRFELLSWREGNSTYFIPYNAVPPAVMKMLISRHEKRHVYSPWMRDSKEEHIQELFETLFFSPEYLDEDTQEANIKELRAMGLADIEFVEDKPFGYPEFMQQFLSESGKTPDDMRVRRTVSYRLKW